MRKVLIIGAIVLVIGGVAGYLVFSKDTKDPAQGLKTVKVSRDDVARVVLATGKIEPLTRVELKSRASGIVEQLLVDVSDEVQAGQVVAELDKTILQARVRQANGSFEGAEAVHERGPIVAVPAEDG